MNHLDSPIFGSTAKDFSTAYGDISSHSHTRSHIDRDISISQFEDNISDVGSFFYEDVLTDKETLQFLNKQFALPRANPNKISIERFVDLVLQELMRRDSEVFDDVSDIDGFQTEFLELLRSNLTTQNPKYLSLNALEVNTRGRGLLAYGQLMASEAQSGMKKKRSEMLNDAIVKELSEVSKMLDGKKKDLVAYEHRLKNLERELVVREKSMKTVLQEEFEGLMERFEGESKDKMLGIQKKFQAHEKATRTKIKLLESKLKEAKDSNNSRSQSALQTSNAEDKYKTKVLSLERSIEFHKQKNVELTKKLAQDQESNATLQQKYTKLQHKVSQLEKTLKEAQASRISSAQKLETGRTNRADLNEDLQSFMSTQEKPLDLADLKEDGKHTPESSRLVEKHSASKGENEEGDTKRKKSPEVLRDIQNNSKSIAQNLSKTKFPSSKVAANDPAESKKTNITTASQAASAKPTTTFNDEVRVLLTVIEAIVSCLKSSSSTHNQSTLQESPSKSQLSPRKSEDSSPKAANIGNLLYPGCQILLPALTELTHLIPKPLTIKEGHIVLELFYQLLNHAFKTRNTESISPKKAGLRSTSATKHAYNELVSVSDNRALLDHDLAPQTEHWRKFVRNTKLNPTAILGAKASANLKDPCIQLFPNSEIQKEVVRTLATYLTTSETTILASKKPSDELTSLDENPDAKYAHILRLLSLLCTLYLTRNKKEQINALQGLIKDLTNDNYIIADFLKEYFIENDCISLIFWLLKEAADELAVMNSLADLFLILGSNGHHYLPFIHQISANDKIKILLWVMITNEDNPEIFEKLCVIFQRVTYHNVLTGKIDSIYLQLFRNKLADAEQDEDSEFLATNLRSILINLQAS